MESERKVMKRIASVGAILLLVCGVYIVAQPMRTQPFFWQDKIVRPDETWSRGCVVVDPNWVETSSDIVKLYQNDAQLAYNIRRLYAVCQQLQARIIQLERVKPVELSLIHI